MSSNLERDVGVAILDRRGRGTPCTRHTKDTDQGRGAESDLWDEWDRLSWTEVPGEGEELRLLPVVPLLADATPLAPGNTRSRKDG